MNGPNDLPPLSTPTTALSLIDSWYDQRPLSDHLQQRMKELLATTEFRGLEVEEDRWLQGATVSDSDVDARLREDYAERMKLSGEGKLYWNRSVWLDRLLAPVAYLGVVVCGVLVILIVLQILPINVDYLPSILLVNAAWLQWSVLFGSVVLSGGLLLAKVYLETESPAYQAFRTIRTSFEQVVEPRYQEMLTSVAAERLRTVVFVGVRGAEGSAYTLPSNAPALVELDMHEIVDTSSVREVRQFIGEHTASAVGLAGGRGAGKSSIMRLLARTQDRTLGIYVPAPTEYERFDLVHRICLETVMAVLGEEYTLRGVGVSPINSPRRLLSMWIGPSLALLGIAVVAIPAVPLAELDPRYLLGGVLIGAGYVVSVVTLWKRRAQLRKSRLRERESDPTKRAAQELLTTLRWSSQRERSASAGGKILGGALEVTGEAKTSQEERTQLRSDLTLLFRSFVRQLSSSGQYDSIVIAVDELDKLPSSDHLIRAVNELKDLFHVEGTHFLVSVSTEALHSFITRGLQTRDAFDSSFDEMIEVDRLSASEAVQILDKRAVGFPEPVALFAYCWSGGRARDLIRTARLCVRRSAGVASEIGLVMRRVMVEDVRAQLRSMLATHRLEPAGQLALTLEESLSPTRLDDADMLAVADTIRAIATESESPQWERVVRWIEHAARCYKVFGAPRSEGQWMEELSSGALDRATDGIMDSYPAGIMGAGAESAR